MHGGFYHIFRTSLEKYLYDVNTDKIIEIPDYVYEYLEQEGDSEDEKSRVFLEELKVKGYLSKHRVKKTEHPYTEVAEFYIENKLKHMLLQVTQNCNLRCEYCIYSGEYNNRTHAAKYMSFETAKKAMDYLIQHSRDAKYLSLGFYGGEPLLNYKLIKQCVFYLEKNSEGKETLFNFTTNGTLIDAEKLGFFVKHNFSIMFSLDGPEAIHDEHRKYAFTSCGSYAKLMENLELIRKEYPDYYKTNVSFNTVIDVERGYKTISDFMKNNQTIKGEEISSNIINPGNKEKERNASSKFRSEYEYEKFIAFLVGIGKVDLQYRSPLMRKTIENIEKCYELELNEGSNQLPDKFHHSGPCVPGSLRIFVTVEGDFFPCERVSETSELTQIGNLDDGINMTKVKKILNMEKNFEDMCHNCWAYLHCGTCVAIEETIQKEYERTGKSVVCEGIKHGIEENFKDYLVLRQLGYDFEGRMME